MYDGTTTDKAEYDVHEIDIRESRRSVKEQTRQNLADSMNNSTAEVKQGKRQAAGQNSSMVPDIKGP